MIPIDELCSNNFRDIEEALVVQHAVDILPVVLDQLFRPKLASVFIFVLQLLQPQAYTAKDIRLFLGQVFL